MKKFHLKKAILPVLLASVMVLTACGGSYTPEATAADDPAAGGAATADAPAPDTGERITLTIPYIGMCDDRFAAAEAAGELDNYDNRYHIALRAAIEADFPQFDVNFVDWGWAESLDQQQRSLIAAGDAPDLVAGEIFMPTYASEGILEPLPQDIVDLVNPSFLIFDPDGNAVAVAIKAAPFMLFYNRDITEAAGFNSAPTTWEEWQANSNAITAAGNGEVWGGGVPSFPHAGGALRATPFFRQLGVDFFQNGELMLNNPDVQRSLEFIRNMNANLPVGLGNGANEDPMWQAFEQDQSIAYVINGPWQAGGATRNGMNWGVAPLPIPADGQEGNCLVGVVYLGVPRAARHIEASFDIIRTAIREDIVRLWFGENMAPPLNSLLNDESIWGDNDLLRVVVESVKGGDLSGLASFPTNDSEIWEIINRQVLARTTMTNDPIEQITQDATAQIENLLR